MSVDQVLDEMTDAVVEESPAGASKNGKRLLAEAAPAGLEAANSGPGNGASRRPDSAALPNDVVLEADAFEAEADEFEAEADGFEAEAGRFAPEPEPERPTPGSEAVSAPTDHPELRALVTKWSVRTESPYARAVVKNLGDRVSIEDVRHLPIAAVEYTVRTVEVRRSPFELPAPDAPAGTPVAASLELALPLLPPFEPSRNDADTVEAIEHLAWREATPCAECESGRVACSRCAGEGLAPCSCGTGTVGETIVEDVECPGCSGSGKTAPRVCIPCDGRGTIQCSTCWGTGKRPDKRPCDRCQDGTVTCGHCEGTGQVQGRCLKCTGPGVLPMEVVREVACPVCDGTSKVPCPDCGETGRLRCDHCKGSGSIVRGELVRRVSKAREVQRLTAGESPFASIHVDPLGAATAFFAADLSAAQVAAGPLSDVDGGSVAATFMADAREAISSGGAVGGRVGRSVVTTFKARIDAWCAEFAVVETGADRTIDCVSPAHPPVDPKTYARWAAKENAARTAAFEEASAAAEAIYVAALAHYKEEVAAASRTEAAPVAPAAAGLKWERDPAEAYAAPTTPGFPRAAAAAVKPTPAAAAVESAKIKWSADADDEAAQAKERRGRFGFRGLLGARRGRDAEAPGEEPTAEPATIGPAPEVPVAIPPVRREVPPPELLPAYEELPGQVRIA